MSVIYIYDEHLKVVDISDTSAMETAKIDMSINEASTLDITSTFKFPDETRYVALRDPIAQRRNHDEDEFLMYRISSSAIEEDGLFSYTFTEFAYDELAYDGYIVEQRPNQSTFNDGLDLILRGTKWKRGLTNIEGKEDLDFFYLTRIEAISELNKKFPAEFRFWLRLKDDGTIEERIVDAVKKRGQNTGKRFETTSNLISLVAEDDFTNVYSAIVPRGKGEEIDSDGDPNTRPGYGRKISIKDVEWSKAKGDPLNKPKGQEWLALDNGETLVDGRLRYKIVNFDDDTDPNVLINHAYVQLLKDSVIKRQFTANAMDLGVSELGDTVQLVDKERHMEYQARIFHIVYDMVDPTNTEVEFGDNIRSESSISNVISNVVIKQDQIINDTNWAIQQADGKNTTYYGKDEPSVAVREGDIWFREQDNATTQMYRYEGGGWVSRDSMNPQRILENFYKNGELDAQRINVVNMNASNIITGTINTQLIDFSSSEWKFTLDNHGLTMIKKSDTGRKTMIAPEKMTWQYTRSTGQIEPGFEIRMNYGIHGQGGDQNVDLLNIMSRHYVQNNPTNARGDGVAIGRYDYGYLEDIDNNDEIGNAWYSAVAASNNFPGSFNSVGFMMENQIEDGFHMYGQGEDAGYTGHIWSDTIHTFRDTIWANNTLNLAAVDMKAFALNTGDWGMQLVSSDNNSGIAISGNTVYMVLNGQYYNMKNYIK